MNLARIRRDIAAAQQYFDYVEDRATAAGSLMALIAADEQTRLDPGRHLSRVLPERDAGG